MFRLLFILLLSVPCLAQNNQCGRKGFERLVLLANANEISDKELEESLVIADSLQAINCRAYAVDRFGKVYAKATLTWLFARIVSTRNDSAAVYAYTGYLARNIGTADEEMTIELDLLLRKQPELTLRAIIKHELYELAAWGFLNNAGSDINKHNYQMAFFLRHPALKERYATYKSELDKLLNYIEAELE